jgi:hypothetical protein
VFSIMSPPRWFLQGLSLGFLRFFNPVFSCLASHYIHTHASMVQNEYSQKLQRFCDS